MNRAALLQVAHEFQRKERIGSDSISTEGGTVTYPQLGLLAEVKKRLNQYIHPLKF
jgi:hypothetical protein